jgi:hypothetical protein
MCSLDVQQAVCCNDMRFLMCSKTRSLSQKRNTTLHA